MALSLATRSSRKKKASTPDTLEGQLSQGGADKGVVPHGKIQCDSKDHLLKKVSGTNNLIGFQDVTRSNSKRKHNADHFPHSSLLKKMVYVLVNCKM